jgi:hypothetical protein
VMDARRWGLVGWRERDSSHRMSETAATA